MEHTWKITNELTDTIRQAHPELPDLLLQLLANRGVTDPDDVHAFLTSEYEHLHDPFVITDMKQVVERLLRALQSKEQVMVLGDYDADGVSGATIVYHVLAELTPFFAAEKKSRILPGYNWEDARLIPYIPDRTREGYGVSDKAVEYAFQNNVSVLITIDCGVSNHDRLKFLKEHGIDVIVLDHHSIPETLPEAHSLLIPKRTNDAYPFKELCGAGLAFKLASALITESRFEGLADRIPEGYEKWYLDFAAIGTVGDMVPLQGENRVLVTYGLYVLSKTKNEGLKKLLRQMHVAPEVRQDAKENTEDERITVHTVGFELAPRINAAGRIDHANRAFELFSARSEEEAAPIAQKLTDLNDERKEVTERVVQEVKERLREKGEFLERTRLIFEGDENWPIGVLGIAASRLMEIYHRPIVLYQAGQEYHTASARSIPGFHMADAIQSVMDHLEAGGGHAQAGGMSFQPEETATIKEKLQTRAHERLTEELLKPRVLADAEVDASQVTWDLYDLVNRLAPFGMGNPTPVFILRNVRIERLQLVGKSKEHLKLQLQSQQERGEPLSFSAIGFRMADTGADLFENEIVDVAFKLDVNEWRNTRELQLKLVDVKSAE
jgi:single-stranded-DNA-specific exonuclease